MDDDVPKSLRLALCETQGRLFELSAKYGFDSETFIRAYMTSPVSADMDKSFHHMQWAGEGYIMERMMNELRDQLSKGEEIYGIETLHWMGYLYRHWHFQTGEKSTAIYKQAPAKVMRNVYPMYHTMDPDMAVERLKESYSDRHPSTKVRPRSCDGRDSKKTYLHP